MRNVRLDEAQSGIKIANRNINNLRCTDDTPLMAESKELKNLLMKVKEQSEKAGLKLNVLKTKIMASNRSVKLSHSVVSDPLKTPWTAAHQTSLSITNSQSLLKLMSIESTMLSNHLNLCHPFLLLPSVFPSIRVFSNESVLCIRSPKYWSFNFSPSNEY